LLLVAVFTANVAIGQIFSVAGKDVYLGVRAGWNSSKFTGADIGSGSYPDAPKEKRKAGIHLGAVLDFQITDAFSVQPGILFSQHGGKAKDPFSIDLNVGGTNFGNRTTKTILNYIQIPIMAEYKIDLRYSNKGNRRQLVLFAGPSLDFGLNGKIKGGVFDDDDEEKNIDITFGSGDEDMFKRLGVRFGFGVGWLRNETFQFNIGVMNRGIISIVDGANIFNNHFTLNGIYYFGK